VPRPEVSSSLPSQSTSFVDRAGELARQNPLALAVAARQTAAFADRVAFVALASVGTMLDHALATARSMIGADVFAAVWAEAQTLRVEQILNGLPSAAVFTAVRDR
jgi:hypothetical protein